MERKGYCAWPKCGKASGYRYCSYHNGQIKYAGLCYNCRQKKEHTEHRLCAACFSAENEVKRQTAVSQGKCTNFWKCTNPASCSGGMCAQCFKEFSMKHEAERQAKRQAAIDAGKCTNFWKCTNPASCAGGMCTACFQEYKTKARAQTVVAVATVVVVQEAPKKVPEPMNFPPLPSAKAPKQKPLHAWGASALTEAVKATLRAPPPPEEPQSKPAPKQRALVAISAWNGTPEFVYDDGTAEWGGEEVPRDQPEEVAEWDQPDEVAEWDRPDDAYDQLNQHYRQGSDEPYPEGEEEMDYDDDEEEYSLSKRH
jgi:hypothetical protein